MRDPTNGSPLPADVDVSLRALGDALRAARKRRRLTQQEVAGRLGVTRETITRLERGDPGVRIGTLIQILWLFGLLDQWERSIAPDQDILGRALEQQRLPQRVKRPNRADDEF